MELVPTRTSELRPLRRMERLWDTFFNHNGWDLMNLEPLTGNWAPALDIEEADNEIKITAELPGIEAKDVDITATGDIVTIKGEKKQETKEKKKNYQWSERCYGAFQRTVRLPSNIDADRCKAEYKNGVLTLSCPKAESSKSKHIDIKVN